MKIIISNDHAATELKKQIMEHLKNYEVTDIGSDSGNSDYPKYAASAAKAVAKGEYSLGILICGTGAGMCIAANKIRGIRAVVCSEPTTARLSREHNNAQILCLGARVVGAELAKEIVDAFIGASFQGGRHQPRVEMLMALEQVE